MIKTRAMSILSYLIPAQMYAINYECIFIISYTLFSRRESQMHANISYICRYCDVQMAH